MFFFFFFVNNVIHPDIIQGRVTSFIQLHLGNDEESCLCIL